MVGAGGKGVVGHGVRAGGSDGGGTGSDGGGSGLLPLTGSDLRLVLVGSVLVGLGAVVLASRRRAARSA